MKALVLEENAKLVYKDAPQPKRDCADWLGIQVKAAGICGSDMGRGFDNGAYHHPLIMGHEFSGIIDDPANSAVYKKGDRVVVFPLLWCGHCTACQTGDYALCSDYDYFGSRRDGAFAEYLYAPQKSLLRIPDHVDIVHAAMAEPAAVALHGVRKFSIVPGHTAAVYGAGPIGNMVAQWLRINGCRRVFIVDVDKEKLAIAEKMGLEPILGGDADPVAAIKKATNGAGANKVVEAVGFPGTFLQAIQTASSFGEVVFMGNLHGKFQIEEKDFSSILRRELRIHGTWNSKWTPTGLDDWTTVLEYMDKELVVTPLISHTPPLAESADFFTRLAKREIKANKVIFVM
jgi:Threonine dehydrogenase and related Zn-dependent dehydrogenases